MITKNAKIECTMKITGVDEAVLNSAVERLNKEFAEYVGKIDKNEGFDSELVSFELKIVED